LLAVGATPAAVAEHLCGVEKDWIGTTPVKPSDLLSIAEKLCRIDVSLDRK
jgi:hypothetical protein